MKFYSSFMVFGLLVFGVLTLGFSAQASCEKDELGTLIWICRSSGVGIPENSYSVNLYRPDSHCGNDMTYVIQTVATKNGIPLPSKTYQVTLDGEKQSSDGIETYSSTKVNLTIDMNQIIANVNPTSFHSTWQYEGASEAREYSCRRAPGKK